MARNRLYLDAGRDYEDETIVKQFLNPYKDQALDYAFGEEPEQGSMYDLGRSLLDSNYDPKGSFLGRALKDTPEITNDFYDDSKGLDLESNIVGNEEEVDKPIATKRKATTFNVADTRTSDLPLYEVNQTQTDSMRESEEEKKRMINALRGY
jgi:hypothetical protein|tara:strand:- start:46 stop:501 length:456 start_codon:yes stop_codon:yes gene_type:complete